MRVRVRVLRRHIAEGKPNDAYRCPLALASGERIDLNFLSRLGPGCDITFYSLTAEAKEFSARFDAGRPVKPGWITLYEENE